MSEGNTLQGLRAFGSGATSSSEKPRYDLIPFVALRALANRFGYGARVHGDHNYKQGANDPKFVRDRMNHLIEHMYNVIAGDDSDEQLGAVMCNAAMLLELRRLRNDPVEFERVAALAMREKQERAMAECKATPSDPRVPVEHLLRQEARRQQAAVAVGETRINRDWQRPETALDNTPDGRYARG